MSLSPNDRYSYEDFIQHISFKQQQEGQLLCCLVRRAWVKDTPEERVRQYALYQLLEQGYSRGLIAVERVFYTPYGMRRMDILAHDSHLQPFLLIECKRHAMTLSNRDFEQLHSYQIYWKAQHMVLFNGVRIRLFTVLDEGGFHYALAKTFPIPPDLPK